MMPKSITHLSQMNVLMDSLNSLDISSQNQGIYHLNLWMQVTSGSLYNPINVKYGVCLALHISIKYFENQLHEKICFYIHYMGHFLTVSVISNPNYPWGNVCTHSTILTLTHYPHTPGRSQKQLHCPDTLFILFLVLFFLLLLIRLFLILRQVLPWD